MTIIPLSAEEHRGLGFTHKLVLTAADIIDKTSGTAFAVFSAAAGDYVRSVALRISDAFTFAAGTCAIEVGDGGDAARFIASKDLKTLGWAGQVQAKVPHVYAAADTIDVEVTVGAGDIADVADGQVEIFLEVLPLARLADA